jgi:hypothetical protein
MNAARATLAIARREMNPQWLVAVLFALGFGCAAAIGVRAGYEGLLTVGALGAAAAAGSTLGVRDAVYFVAPLYGRQLARAHAVVALAGGWAFPVGALLGTLFRNTQPSGQFVVALLSGTAVAAVVALSATLRDGLMRRCYQVAGFVIGLVVIAPSAFDLPHASAATLALALPLGFFALRAFGETLARYDPLS